MNISEQTQRDLETILETLDQRIYELSEGPATSAQQETRLLRGLRDNVKSSFE